MALYFFACTLSLVAPAACPKSAANEIQPVETVASLIANIRSKELTQEQASAVYASLYARDKLPYAQRTVWVLNVQHQAGTDKDRFDPRPVEVVALPGSWQARIASELDSIDSQAFLDVDASWEKVRDRSLLSQRIDRSATLIQTKNFLIEAEVPASSVAELVFECELTHAVVNKICNIRENHPPLWVRVVRNRAAYMKLLKREVAQIGITSGYFDIDKNTVFCYVDKQVDTTSSLRHELTHLILTNSWAEGSTGDFKRISDFWAFEAIATYVESMIVRSGINELCCMVGGWESPRLQAARYRRLHDMSWIPFDELRSLQQSAYQSPEDIQLRYSQSAGLAHYWLDNSEATREHFVRYLQSVHRGAPDASILGVTDDEAIRKAYDTFLLADRNAFQTYILQPARKDIVLSRTAIQSADLASFPPSHRKLDWFDLSFTQVDGSWLNDDVEWDATRLNVESTAISNGDVRSIAQMESLHELDLSNCRVDDAGIQYLSGQQKLETLWLTGTGITDASAATLRELRALKSVEISNTSAKPDAFKDWLPKTR